jgi:predicted RNA methylase|tara:strand:- start:4 stop:669 length:666 start_codon:yes stop_codon:yes gene_type:complete
MKKVVKLKESDLQRIVKRVLNEVIMRPPFEPKHDSHPDLNTFEKIINHSFEDIKNSGKKIGSIDIGYTNEIYDSGRPELSDNYKLFVFNEEQTPILYLGFNDFLDGFKIGTISSIQESRGKGLAIKIYVGISKEYKKPIYSDSTQTEASRFAIWDKLIKSFPNNVVGFNQKTNQDLKLDFTNGEPMALGNQSIYVTKKHLTKFSDWDRTRLLKLTPIYPNH